MQVGAAFFPPGPGPLNKRALANTPAPFSSKLGPATLAEWGFTPKIEAGTGSGARGIGTSPKREIRHPAAGPNVLI
jgi:hypothetical protein